MDRECDRIAVLMGKERQRARDAADPWPTPEALHLRQMLAGRIDAKSSGSNAAWLAGIGAAVAWGIGVYVLLIADMRREMSAVETICFALSIAAAMWGGRRLGQSHASGRLRRRYSTFLDLGQRSDQSAARTK
jgi:hypothetical protein